MDLESKVILAYDILNYIKTENDKVVSEHKYYRLNFNDYGSLCPDDILIKLKINYELKLKKILSSMRCIYGKSNNM